MHPLRDLQKDTDKILTRVANDSRPGQLIDSKIMVSRRHTDRIMLLWSIEPKIDWNRLLQTIESKHPVAIMIISNSDINCGGHPYLHLTRDALDEQPVRHQPDVLAEVVDGDPLVLAALAQLDVGVAGQREVEPEVLHRAAVHGQVPDLELPLRIRNLKRIWVSE